MNYKRLYDDLIEYRKSNPITEGYIENHHILPRSLGGKDTKDNIISLTAREHYIAHLLLARFNPCRQTTCAILMMQCGSKNQNRPNIRNNRMYEWARKEFSKYPSHMKGHKYAVGNKNSQYGTMWICNIELKENKKIPKDSEIPASWIKGRNKWNVKPRMAKPRNPRDYSKTLDKAERLYRLFRNKDYKSVTEFITTENINMTLQGVCKLFRNNIPEYKTCVKQGRGFKLPE